MLGSPSQPPWRVLRVDLDIAAFVAYLLPRSSNSRRVFVDESTGALSVGGNHGGSIVEVQLPN